MSVPAPSAPARFPDDTSAGTVTLGATNRRNLGLAALVFVVATLLFARPELIVHRAYGGVTSDVLYMRTVFRDALCVAAAFTIAWLVQPATSALLARCRGSFSPQGKRLLAIGLLTLVSVLMAAFIVFFGRWQFGGFDYNILLDIGWRQVLGQRPYVDFFTTSPPLFNLGILTAFRLFGVSWDGMLLFTVCFAVVTFVWIYSLLRRLGIGIAGSLGTAFTLQAATMLVCCFWWYNDSTLLLAAIFFLASLILFRDPRSVLGQVSFVLSMALLALAKPNIAGITIVGCVALLLVSTRQLVRILLLCLAGAALTLLIFRLAHISLPDMLAAYRGAAKERGAFSTFGFDEYKRSHKLLIEFWYLMLYLPLLQLRRPLGEALHRRDRHAAALWLFFPLAAVIATYGLLGNGEFYNMETTALVCSLALMVFVHHLGGARTQRYVVALLCAMAVSSVYVGVSRERIYTIGPHKFFEWNDRDHVLREGRLKNMRVSGTFLEVNTEVGQVLHTDPGPYFFGSRVDYAYMAYGLPSPTHFPAWWHPGTAFDRARTPDILAHWDARRFPTLVYMKDDYIYYPQSFLDLLKNKYTRDDHYDRITVYRRRPGL